MFKLEYSSFVEDPINFRITRDALTVSKRMLSEAALLCSIELHITNWTRCAQLKVTFLFQHGGENINIHLVYCQRQVQYHYMYIHMHISVLIQLIMDVDTCIYICTLYCMYMHVHT